MKKTSTAEKRKKLKKNKELINAALDLGSHTRGGICKSTGIKLHELGKIFRDDGDLYAKYVVLRKTIVDTAADNMHTIINDPTHPHHFQASKFVLTKYKSDLDETLESQGDEEIEVAISPNEGEVEPVTIRFTKKKQ